MTTAMKKKCPTGTRFESSRGVQIGNRSVSGEEERDYLRLLDEKLCSAIRDCLTSGRPHLAVALDTARDFLETIMTADDPSPTRIALARTRAEIALEACRDANDVRH